MGKILVIVESPGKIKKLQALLGPNYIVMASIGHIIDLESKSISVDIKNKFKPSYSTIPGKEQVIKDLQNAAKKADEILLASDEDREGEMIAWSLAYTLGLKNPKRIAFNSITQSELDKAIKNPRKIDENLVDAQKTRRILDRIVGYEISPILWRSIKATLSAGRVQSVVTRIIIDKENDIKNFMQEDQNSYFKFDGTFLDNKDKPFKAFLYSSKAQKEQVDEMQTLEEPEETIVETEIKGLRKGSKAKIYDEDDARGVMKDISKSTFKIDNIADKDSLRYPSAPFTTSTLQQEAARKLGFTVKRTMTAAQHLYEAGHITYMRTDSVNLSKEAIEDIKKFVMKKYGKEYYMGKNYDAKTKNTQEAHEAVRPTEVSMEFIKEESKIGSDETRLYNLIWKRAVSSQMTPAQFIVKNIEIDISKLKDYYFLTQIENVKFPGFLKVYNIASMEATEENTNIDLKKGSKLGVECITGTQDYDKAPARYNEASLVSKLDPKNLNIGRPSTYASIINKIQERGYVKKEDIPGEEKEVIILSWDGGKKIKEKTETVTIGKEASKLIPTSMGVLVNDFLVKHFPTIMDYKFTASMEDNLDDIAEGNEDWVKVLDKFYKTFHPIVEKLMKEKTLLIDEIGRVLGKHPETGDEIIATIAKYGPVVKMCTSKTKCVYAPIKDPLTKDTITLKDALKLFEYPKEIGKYNRKLITLNKGKHGLYLKWGDVNISLEEKEKQEIDEDLATDKKEKLLEKQKLMEETYKERNKLLSKIKDKDNITLEEAVALLEDKRKNILWEDTDDKITYTILNGPYGKYINVKDEKSKIKKKPVNVKLPEDIEEDKIKDLTIDKVKELVKEGMENKYKKYKKKDGDDKTKQKGGKTTKKTTAKKSAPKKKPTNKTTKK